MGPLEPDLSMLVGWKPVLRLRSGSKPGLLPRLCSTFPPGKFFHSGDGTGESPEKVVVHRLISVQLTHQSNGIAERFVRSLKEWLADKARQSDKHLSEFLRLFLLEYNDRPHQGLPIPGLSPNEFANRIWLL